MTSRRHIEIAALAAALLATGFGPARADERNDLYDGDDRDGVAAGAVAARGNGLHLGVQLEAPLTGASSAGITMAGVGLTIRKDWMMLEGAYRSGAALDGGGGSMGELRAGVMLGIYGAYGALRLGLSAGAAVAQWTRAQEYSNQDADLTGVGGESSLGYLAPFGLEVRLALSSYHAVSGDYVGDTADGNGITHQRPASFGRVGLSFGYEF